MLTCPVRGSSKIVCCIWPGYLHNRYVCESLCSSLVLCSLVACMCIALAITTHAQCRKLAISRSYRVQQPQCFKPSIRSHAWPSDGRCLRHLQVAIGIVLQLLQINLIPFATAGGVGGILLGFASQSVLANIVAGTNLLITRQAPAAGLMLIFRCAHVQSCTVCCCAV